MTETQLSLIAFAILVLVGAIVMAIGKLRDYFWE